MKKKAGKRKDELLRNQYESGDMNAEEFLQRLFSTKEADRTRRNIVEKNKKFNKRMQEV